MSSEFSVVHLTSVHPRSDTRIFLKECRSLARAGYSVALVVADGKGNASTEGVEIFDVGVPSGRLDRMRHSTRRVLAKALELDATVYHLHDPELLPVGLKLKAHGKRVVFDAHEDVPKQLLGKPYLGPISRRLVSWSFAAYERWVCRRLDGIITATPFIREKYLRIHANVLDVNNFPMRDELAPSTIDWSRKRAQIAYVGGIARIRGILEAVQAMEMVHRPQARLSLGGRCSEASFKKELESQSGWGFVDDLGFLDRDQIRALLSESVAGLVTLHPVINYLDALPVKMFEYMSAGIPVIASDFPLWREIVEGNRCGICVDPLDPRAIAQAMDRLLNDPEGAEQMGRNGQKAVQERYNWDIEEKKLLAFYAELFCAQKKPA